MRRVCIYIYTSAAIRRGKLHSSEFRLKSLHSTSCYSTTWWSGHRAFHQSTVPHGGQITTSQHSTAWWSDYHQSTVPHGGQITTSQQYRMVVRLPPVNTVPHGGQITTSQHSTAQITTSQHSTAWWSDYHQSTQYRTVVRLPPVNTVPHGGQMKILWDCNQRRRDSDVRAEPCSHCLLELGALRLRLPTHAQAGKCWPTWAF